jgi:hypothetical protein
MFLILALLSKLYKMKKLNYLLNLSCVVVFLLVGCSKKSDDPTPASPTVNNQTTTTITPTPKKSFEKKWIVNSNSSLRQEAVDSTNILSIEFSKTSYVIVLSDSTLLVGTYTTNDNATLVLAKYGTIIFNSQTENSLKFSVKRKANQPAVELTSSPAPYVAETNKDLNFYKTWKVVKYEFGGDTSLTNYFARNISELYVTFSGYGTYLVQTKYTSTSAATMSSSDESFDGTYYYGVNTWVWSSDLHNSFCYGEWSKTAVVCGSFNQVKIEYADDAHTIMHLEESGSNMTKFKYTLEVQ